jgi:hypothetical protein
MGVVGLVAVGATAEADGLATAVGLDTAACVAGTVAGALVAAFSTAVAATVATMVAATAVGLGSVGCGAGVSFPRPQPANITLQRARVKRARASLFIVSIPHFSSFCYAFLDYTPKSGFAQLALWFDERGYGHALVSFALLASAMTGH